GQRAPQHHEARLGELDGPIQIEQLTGYADLLVWLRGEVEGSRCPPAAYLDVVGIAGAPWHRRMRHVGDLEEQGLHLLVSLLHLHTQSLNLAGPAPHPLASLGRQGAAAVMLSHLLRGAPVLGLEFLAFVDETATLHIDRHERADELRATLLG